MTLTAIAVVAVLIAVAIVGLVVWLYELRFQREYRKRMEWLRYRAERRGVLLP